MKTFRYAVGHEAGTTLTVGELIEALKNYPPQMPVMCEWEGCNAFVKGENFGIIKVTKGHKDDTCDCLVVDVNQY